MALPGQKPLMRLAEHRKVVLGKLYHVVVPEDSYSSIADEGPVAFVVKSGVIRVARERITVWPLIEDSLTPYLASRMDDTSKVKSELVIAFMHNLSVCRQSSYNPFQVRGSLEKMPEKRVDARSGVFNNVAAAQRVLNDHLSQLRLKRSSQRDTILRVFLATRDHLTTEELHVLVKKQEPTIGYTTVYRALKLFIQCGLAVEIEFHDGVARFEHHMNRRNHHHMICTTCGDSVEFFSPEIEEIERRIGKKFHYVTTQHSFQIYGTCEACRKKRSRLES